MVKTLVSDAIKLQKINSAPSSLRKNHSPKILSLIFVLFFSFTIHQASAQDYSHALGLRFGSTKGITYKNFIGDSQALEGMFVYHQDGFRGIGVFEQHFFLGRRSNSAIYLGIGGYAGVTALLDEYPGKLNVAGITAIAGFEYTFSHSNLIFALDLNPAYELIQKSGFSGNQAAVSLRYMLD